MESSIATRIKSRQLIDEMIALEEDAIAQLAEPAIFWELLAARATEKAESMVNRPVVPKTVVQRMSNDQVCMFAKWRIPFGKHEGKTVGEVTEEDPAYLLWLADAEDEHAEFKHKLKAYALNQAVNKDLNKRAGNGDDNEW